MVLWRNQITKLKVANKAIVQQKQCKRKHFQKGGVLTYETRLQLVAKDSLTTTFSSKKSWSKARADGVKPTQRHYRNCGGTGYNTQTY